MAIKEPIPVINLALTSEKKKLMAHIGSLPPGLYDVLIKPRKKVRSLQANRYYFAAVCQPFCEWLRREWGDPSITIDDAHDILKAKVLGWDERIIEQTGEVVKRLPRSKDLDKWDFNNYIDKAAAWLAELGIVVIPSELFWEGATEGKGKLRD